MFVERIVAVRLLTSAELALLGPRFERMWPVDEAPWFLTCFELSTKPIGRSDVRGRRLSTWTDVDLAGRMIERLGEFGVSLGQLQVCFTRSRGSGG